LNLGNGWGIVRTVVDLIRNLDEDEEEGSEDKLKKFVLVKDPNKPVIRLYSVPASTFEEEDAIAEELEDKGEEEEE